MTELEDYLFREFNNTTAYTLTGFELERHYAETAANILSKLTRSAFEAGNSGPELSEEDRDKYHTLWLEDYIAGL